MFITGVFAEMTHSVKNNIGGSVDKR